MHRSCTRCSASFTIHADEEAFLQKLSFTYGGRTFHPPLPVFCPDCRSQIRTSHRNERYLYKVRSALSGKDIVSIFSGEPVAESPYKIYAQDEWKSDAWDPLSYGREIDDSRPIFEQLGELHKAVPRVALITIGNENSDFSTGTGYCKNCYLINSSEYCEDCYYGKLLQKCVNVVDCSYMYDSQHCHGCFSVYNSYECQSVSFSQNCQQCFFSSNLRSCRNCCLCTNLDHKEYHWLNQPLSKEEYGKRLQEFRGSFAKTEQMHAKLRESMQSMIRKYANIVNSEHCSGDYIENSRNCLDCYDMTDSEDCRYVRVGVNINDCYDCENMYLKSELCYDTLGTIEAYNVAYCLFVFHSQRLLYCDYCYSCSDCFGCSGLTRKQYCIFNAQHTKEEYEQLVPKILDHMQKTGEWGRFFPPHLSPFGYNESLAQEYFPLQRELALTAGFHWREINEKERRPATEILPDPISDVPDSITKELLICMSCKKNYRIIPQELLFYRTHTIPAPRLCPDCRYDARLKLRNPRKLWERSCAKCQKKIQTTYAPDRPETVYCEDCYLQTVY